MEIISQPIKNPDSLNLILGQSHFIKTVEDIHEALVGAVPGIQFGLAFCEASADCLIRCSGSDQSLIDLAAENALALSSGHSFIVFLKNCYPLNVLNAIKIVPEVCRIFCATANPVEVILAKNEQGRGILGVIDGLSPKGVESSEKAEERRRLLRAIGYKL